MAFEVVISARAEADLEDIILSLDQKPHPFDGTNKLDR
jgi:hypothetical protein